jgi:hypothetical protein
MQPCHFKESVRVITMEETGCLMRILIFFPDAKKNADGFVADVQGRLDKNDFIFNRRYYRV